MMEVQRALEFHQKYLNFCSEDEGLTGLEQHGGGLLMTDFSFLGELTI